MRERPLLILAGPTGVGKSRLAVELAHRTRAEIVSADSRQLYQGLNIGTATPTAAERGGIRHHLLDVLAPSQRVTAGWFQARAQEAITEIRGRGKSVVVVGGSTLYVHALLEGLAPLPPLSPRLEADLNRIAEAPDGRDDLYRELLHTDPTAAATLDPSKSQRLVRLVGVVRQTGQRVSDLWEAHTSQSVAKRLVVLNRPRDELYRRIDKRVREMIDGGLVREVESVLERWPASRELLEATIGYRELLPVLDGEARLDDAITLIQRNSRRYAKRQLTWYRRYPEAMWLEAGSTTVEDVADLVDVELGPPTGARQPLPIQSTSRRS